MLLLVFFSLFLGKQDIHAQLGFSQELGVITGPVVFYSDFGQRNNWETNSGNVGFGIGIVHYINFAYRTDCNCYTMDTYFNDHFKLRTEINFHKTEFSHYGYWVRPEKTSKMAEQLRAMSGTSTVIEFGPQLEYYPLSIREFMAEGYKLAPFLSLGAHYVHYDPEVRSTLGKLNTPASTPDKYYNAFRQESGSTFAVLASVGVRYKLSQNSDLMLDSRWTHYFTDYLDGLNPTYENNQSTPVPENKAKDWTYWLNIGYIYYIN